MSRLQKYAEYIGRVRATGSRVITVTMPCCDKQLDMHVPASRPHEWTSLMECPHCGAEWMSAKTRNRVTLARPLEDGEYERHVLAAEKKVAQ